LKNQKLVKLENNLKSKRTWNILNTQTMKREIIGEIKPILSSTKGKLKQMKLQKPNTIGKIRNEYQIAQ
jgi:hypothetical protein